MPPVDPPAQRGLPPEAYETIPGSEYRPYVPASQSLADFTHVMLNLNEFLYLR